MNPQAIPCERRTRFFHGWLGSLALHSLVFLAVISFFRLPPLTVPKEPFHWEVALVESAPRQETALQPVKNTTHMAVNAHAPIATAVNRSPQTASSTLRSMTPVQSTNDKSVAAAPQPETMSPAVQAVTHLVSTTQEAATSLPQAPALSTLHTESPVSSVAQESPMPAKADMHGPPLSESEPNPVEPVQPHAIASAKSDPAPPSRADYSWLQRMISQRLEELKRASPPQLDEVRPLKVLVRAVVSNNGTLLESDVITSSGLDRIDQEAMALVQRAFPMQFDRTLDRRQIVMRIPITYSRD